MQLFPERDRRGRKLLVAALVLSLLVHLAGGGAWVLFARRVAPVLAKLLPHPKPTPDEFVATSDAITIERRTVPRAMRRRRRSRRRAGRARAASRRLPRRSPCRSRAHAAAARRGVADAEPTAVPTYRAAARHDPPSAARRERGAARRRRASARRRRQHEQPAARGAFSPQQIAALDAQFSKTIAQAQRALTDVPPQSAPPRDDDEALPARDGRLARRPHVGARPVPRDADVVPRAAGVALHGLRLRLHRRLQRARAHPVAAAVRAQRRSRGPSRTRCIRSRSRRRAGTLPHPFAFSRLVCIFYKNDCQALIDRERANGDPNYAPP